MKGLERHLGTSVCCGCPEQVGGKEATEPLGYKEGRNELESETPSRVEVSSCEELLGAPWHMWEGSRPHRQREVLCVKFDWPGSGLCLFCGNQVTLWSQGHIITTAGSSLVTSISRPPFP